VDENSDELEVDDIGKWDAHRPIFYVELNSSGYIECTKRWNVVRRIKRAPIKKVT
jgi:hypothetical protein